MKLAVSKAAQPLDGTLAVPGDKSISHRAALISAVSDGPVSIEGFLDGKDCLSTLTALRSLGIRIEGPDNGHLMVHGAGLRGLKAAPGPIDCGNSGTTMRLLAGLLAGQDFSSTLTGDESLSARPMDRIIQPLAEMGAAISGCGALGTPPLEINGGPLRGIDYALPVASAQVKSCVLLAGLLAAGRTMVEEPSRTRDHTERLLGHFGAELVRDGTQVTITPASGLKAEAVVVPGDFSSAAYLLAAAVLVPHSWIILTGLGLNQTRTAFLDWLDEMGATAESSNDRELNGEPVGDVTVRSSALHAVEVPVAELPRMIDELPLMAVVATQAEGETVVTGAGELRVKESDRIEAVCDGLRRLGSDIVPSPDGFRLSGPTRLEGAAVDSYGDHRIAMAMAIAGLIAEGETVIDGFQCADISYPAFVADMNSLGAELRPC